MYPIDHMKQHTRVHWSVFRTFLKGSSTVNATVGSSAQLVSIWDLQITYGSKRIPKIWMKFWAVKMDFSSRQKHWNKVVCIAPPAPTEKMSKNTEADASYDQNIGSRQQAKYHNTRMWYLQGLSFSIWIKLKYSRFCMTALILAYYWGTRRNSFDWLAGPSSQLAGLLWTLSCAPGNICSIFQIIWSWTSIHNSATPASCPDVSFWTLVGFSWWWGEWAAH